MTDKRFIAAKSMIEQKQVKNLFDVFEIIPKSVLAKSLHMKTNTLENKAETISLFTLGEIDALAAALDMDFLSMVLFLSDVEIPKATITDKRFIAVRTMIEQKQLKNLLDVLKFKIVSLNTLSKAVNMKANTLARKAVKVDLFTLGEMEAMARVIGLDFLAMLKFVREIN